jgi:tetratricopeptide (TPR) repeat protein
MSSDRLAKLLKLLDADPRDTFCLYGVAQEHVKRGDSKEALEWFDRTLAIDPDHSYAWFHRAKVQHAAGGTAEAIDSLRQGLAAARRVGDGKAISEIEGWLEELVP